MNAPVLHPLLRAPSAADVEFAVQTAMQHRKDSVIASRCAAHLAGIDLDEFYDLPAMQQFAMSRAATAMINTALDQTSSDALAAAQARRAAARAEKKARRAARRERKAARKK